MTPEDKAILLIHETKDHLRRAKTAAQDAWSYSSDPRLDDLQDEINTMLVRLSNIGRLRKKTK